MSLKELLTQHNLLTALIVDDGYDTVPRSEDLATAEWSTFFDDLGDDRALLCAAFPAYESLDASDLQKSDEFVAVVWNMRAQLRQDLQDALFEQYRNATEYDRKFLEGLEKELQGLGITPLPSGRSIPEDRKNAPLIFVDLFLGSAQVDSDMARSIERVNHLLSGRQSKPPIVILMSRSELLSDKKSVFRDNTPLLGTLFRVHSKEELSDKSALGRTLERLARHYGDALRLADFLYSWEVGLQAARDRFLQTIRRLDLADYIQIRKLLLDFEGQPLGSYLLDIFDRVLQYEIEADPRTIAAAETLNQIDMSRYPAPYISGSPDLQELVHRSIYQNQERLQVTATDCGAPVSFGDVLIKRTALTPSTPKASPHQESDVLVVMTPACDLARAGAKRAILIAGALEELSPINWIHKHPIQKTPIIILPNGQRMWISWDLKDVQTLRLTDLADMLGDAGTHQRVIRLRESEALELQQKLLSDLGRVGLVAALPATFPVKVEAFTYEDNEVLRRWSLPALESEYGVCYVGRNKDKDTVSRLVLSAVACEQIQSEIARLDKCSVHRRAHGNLKLIQESKSFALTIEQGLSVPASNKSGFEALKMPSLDDNGKQLTDDKGKPIVDVVGVVIRNPKAKIEDLIKPQAQNSAFVLVLKDVNAESDESGEIPEG